MRRIVPAALAGLIVLGVGTGAATAQSSSMSQSYAVDDRPDFTARDLGVFVRILRLGADEQAALDVLYDGYAAAMSQGGAKARGVVVDAVERAEVLDDREALGAASKAVAEWRDESEKIRARFLEDLRTLLTRDQESRWPIVERELRRMRRMGAGQLAGESIDLIRCVEDLRPDDAASAAIAPLLERYAEDIDRAIVARDRFLEEHRDGFTDLVQSDPAAAQRVWSDAFDRRKALVTINERFRRLLAAELPPALAADLQRRVRDASFPMLAKPTRVDEYVRAAAQLDSLTTDQRASLRLLQEKHEESRDRWFERSARAWLEIERRNKPEQLAVALGERDESDRRASFTGRLTEEGDAFRELRRERFELDRATRNAVDAVLTPEQREAIPIRDSTTARFYGWDNWGL